MVCKQHPAAGEACACTTCGMQGPPYTGAAIPALSFSQTQARFVRLALRYHVEVAVLRALTASPTLQDSEAGAYSDMSVSAAVLGKHFVAVSAHKCKHKIQPPSFCNLGLGMQASPHLHQTPPQWL